MPSSALISICRQDGEQNAKQGEHVLAVIVGVVLVMVVIVMVMRIFVVHVMIMPPNGMSYLAPNNTHLHSWLSFSFSCLSRCWISKALGNGQHEVAIHACILATKIVPRPWAS